VKMNKILGILMAVCFVLSVTAGAVSAAPMHQDYKKNKWYEKQQYDKGFVKGFNQGFSAGFKEAMRGDRDSRRMSSSLKTLKMWNFSYLKGYTKGYEKGFLAGYKLGLKLKPNHHGNNGHGDNGHGQPPRR